VWDFFLVGGSFFLNLILISANEASRCSNANPGDLIEMIGLLKKGREFESQYFKLAKKST
jgi:hypothetical protein